MDDRYSYEDALKTVQEVRKNNPAVRIGLTSGTFDLLHEGHAAALSEMKKQCDFLVVCITPDVRVRARKGEDRPLRNEQGRLQTIEAFRAVDHVVLSEENDSKRARLIEILKPDVFFSGMSQPKRGGAINHTVSSGTEISSTSIIKKIILSEKEREKYRAGRHWKEQFDWYKDDDDTSRNR